MQAGLLNLRTCRPGTKKPLASLDGPTQGRARPWHRSMEGRLAGHGAGVKIVAMAELRCRRRWVGL